MGLHEPRNFHVGDIKPQHETSCAFEQTPDLNGIVTLQNRGARRPRFSTFFCFRSSCRFSTIGLQSRMAKPPPRTEEEIATPVM
jgi:hypothetical protein